VNLRARLALTVGAIVIPLALGFTRLLPDLPNRSPPPGVPIAHRPRVRLPPLRFVPLAVVMAVVLGALGPVVARIRRLTGAVRRSARDGYADPVAVEGDDEVAALARAFNEAAAEVREHLRQREQRERALRDFIENTTHDLAIPLTVLQGHLAALAGHAREGRAAPAALVSAAMDEAHYMASLASNLTAAARMESSAPAPERAPLALAEVVARVVARHRPVAAQRGVSLDSGVSPGALTATGDVTLVEQCLSNLVHNAIRYNREGGHVAVLLEDDGPSRFRLRVIDDGPGMTPDDLARLPERRQRGAGARTRHPEGCGLGLDIARRVADAHGWTLTFARSEFDGLEATLAGPTG
jgi:signal transduction histidine kinase